MSAYHATGYAGSWRARLPVALAGASVVTRGRRLDHAALSIEEHTRLAIRDGRRYARSRRFRLTAGPIVTVGFRRIAGAPPRRAVPMRRRPRTKGWRAARRTMRMWTSVALGGAAVLATWWMR